MLQSKTIYCIYQSKLYCHYFNIHRTLHTHFTVLLTLILAPLTFFCEAPLSVYYAHYSLLFSTLISNASDEKQALDRKTSNYTTCKQQITNTTDVNKKRKKREGERESGVWTCDDSFKTISAVLLQCPSGYDTLRQTSQLEPLVSLSWSTLH